MLGVEFEFAQDDFLKQMKQLQVEKTKRLALLGERIGYEVIAYLRSHTSETRPPSRPGYPERRAHPGGWADITSTLALSYRFEVRVGGRRVAWSKKQAAGSSLGALAVDRAPEPDEPASEVEIVFINGAEYAAALEAKEGYWVLSGIEQPGGPIEKAIRKAVAVVAPDWRIE